jgi:hypothetical protein
MCEDECRKESFHFCSPSHFRFLLFFLFFFIPHSFFSRRPTQGACGSCWAYVAAGSVEASAARSAALDAYQGFKTSHSSSSSTSGRRNGSSNKKVNINKPPPSPAGLEDVDVEALTNARRVEHNAMKLLNLSIQELIDCDTQADEGCIGGNPILAFYFIHRYGLVSWEQYPYGVYDVLIILYLVFRCCCCGGCSLLTLDCRSLTESVSIVPPIVDHSCQGKNVQIGMDP